MKFKLPGRHGGWKVFISWQPRAKWKYFNGWFDCGPCRSIWLGRLCIEWYWA